MKTVNNLTDLLAVQLKEIYASEKQQLKNLPRLIKKAENPDLKTLLMNYLEQTKLRIERIEKSFFLTGQSATEGKCEVMEDLLERAEKITLQSDAHIGEAGLIMGIQCINHL